MEQWYCVINGQQYGPVSKEELERWAREGRLMGHHLVWTAGMASWAPAVSVLPGMATTVAYATAPSGLVPTAPIGGTGGQTANAQITAQAREILKGQWGLPIGFALLLGLLSIGIQSVPYIGGLASLILQGPLELGGIIFFLTFSRRSQAELGQMFHGFRHFGIALAAYLLRALLVLAWLLLLIVPGIIMGLAYSQTFYVIADDRTLGPYEAMKKSSEMMRGHKWRLFCLGLRMFGWALLCLLTCGIGFFWLVPYMNTCYARFYEDLLPPQATAQLAPVPAMP